MKKLSLITLLTSVLCWSQQQDNVSSFLSEKVQKGDLTENDTHYNISSEHVSKISNVRHIYYRQTINNIEVLGTESSLHLKNNSEIVHSNSRLIPNIADKVTSNTSSISPEEAIKIAANEFNISNIAEIQFQYQKKNGLKVYKCNSLGNNATALKRYLLQANGEIKLAWQVYVEKKDGHSALSTCIDSGNGKLLDKQELIKSCNNHSNVNSLNHKHSSPKKIGLTNKKRHRYGPINFISEQTTAIVETYEVYPLPLESPLLGNRQLISNPANPTASPFGWHDTNGIIGPEFTITRGNNAFAYDDINATNSTSGISPDGGSNLRFSFPFDEVNSSGQPLWSTTNRSLNAAITNAFYWTNISHDILYQYGFDEASGNFQINNYGNGGSGNDSVLVEIQDSSNTCNANFLTLQDGIAPRMQIFTCIDIDIAYDNIILVHEYAHGLTIRLTGGSNNFFSLVNAEQMGEGWSDYYAIMLTMNNSNFNSPRPIGNYLAGLSATDIGLRSFPISNNISINPLTYQDIINMRDSGRRNISVNVNAVGDVWTTMLYEMTQDLITKHGFDPDLYSGNGGNNIALKIVTEALKLQPSNPGFVDARDAILKADLIINNGDNQCLIWEAFAKRGLGFSAQQNDPNLLSDGVAATDTLGVGLTLNKNEICTSQGIQTISGGIPFGGTYSGPGVTDNGNGIDFNFNPTVAGTGIHTISYQSSDCSGNLITATNTITVNETLPVIENCLPVTLELDRNGIATLDVFSVNSIQFETGSNFLLRQGQLSQVLTISNNVTINFDWEFNTAENVNGTTLGFFLGDQYIQLNDGISTNQTGSVSLDLNSNQQFGFGVEVTNLFTTAAAPSTTAIFKNFNIEFIEAAPSFKWTEINNNVNGTATLVGPSTTVNSFCGDLTVSYSQNTFNDTNIGITPVTVTITDSLGNSDSCNFDVSVNDTGVTLAVIDNEINTQTSIEVFPNPTSERINIKLPNHTTETTIEVFSLSGKVLQNLKSNKGNITINLSTYQSGLYFISIKNEEKTITKNIFKN